MSCSTCKKVVVVEPGKSGLQYSLAHGVSSVEGRLGKVYPLTTPLIPKPHTPKGGWGVTLYLHGQPTQITGATGFAVYTAASRFLSQNEVEHSTLNLWFNLNIQWVSRAIEKYQNVPLVNLLALGTPNY